MSQSNLMEKTCVSSGLDMAGIMAINSLGGPPLPLEESGIGHIKVTLENQASTGIQRWQVNVAGMVSRRHR